MNRNWLIPIGLTVIVCLTVGIIIGYFANGDSDKNVNQPTPTLIVTAQLAPNGMAYCPAAPSTPHVTPCLNQP